MSTEQIGIWSDLAQIIASIATVGALIAVIFEIRKSRQIESRETAFETQKMWKDLSEALKRERGMFWDDFENFKQKYSHGDQTGLRDFFDIMNFLEMISQLVQLGILEKDIMIEMWGQPAIFYYLRYKEILLSYRNEFGPTWYEKVDWLAEESIKVYPEIVEGFVEFSEKQMESVRK